MPEPYKHILYRVADRVARGHSQLSLGGPIQIKQPQAADVARIFQPPHQHSQVDIVEGLHLSGEVHPPHRMCSGGNTNGGLGQERWSRPCACLHVVSVKRVGARTKA